MAEDRIYKTAAYLRLSKGDEDVDGIEKQESNSISNQRLLIEKFIEQHPEMELVDTYIDDGYTGTDFKRPEMKRMMYDIDDGRIDCVVVKDLSRFGRERIQTGNYIQKVFG
jgi:DNA invertase Pin-like site-specific DNA recombinase